MAEQNKVDKTHDPRRKDLRILVIMLAIYAICCMIFLSGSFIWIREDRKAVSANATATDAIAATQRANATATSIAHNIELDQYDYIERFEDVPKRWFVGNIDDEDETYTVTVADGVYKWDIIDSNDYLQGTDFYQGFSIRDFDAYVDIKFQEGVRQGAVCSGLTFRESSYGWEDGIFIFSICNDAHFEVYYYDLNGWQEVTYSSRNDLIHREGWNRIEISAKGYQYKLTINNVMVFEATDDRRNSGALGLYIEIDDDTPTEVWFDNFGFRRR